VPAPTPENLTALRRARDQSLATLASAHRRIVELESLLRDAERTEGDQFRGAADRIRAQLDEVRAEAVSEKERQRGLKVAVEVGLRDWLVQTPEQLVDRLPAVDPFLLFPVSLETRFVRTKAGAPELLVRIWPDDISIALPPGDLTKTEREAGEQYWNTRALFAATPQSDAARQSYEGAWNAIATRSGAYRAGWVVRETRPSNWDDLTKPPLAMPLKFPLAEEAAEPRIARADVLPDRFVITGTFGDRTFPDVVGEPIPDDLALAPDPALAEPWVERDPKGKLIVADPLKWMFDFDEAVAVGMGVRIPLTPPWDSTGFELLMAIGVRGATGPADGVKRVETLFAKHRFDTGCGIVRNGTPTNNTNSGVSGWRPASTEAEQLFAIEDKLPEIAPSAGLLSDTDGLRLVRLLGLSRDFVSRLPNATATDLTESLVMNRAASFATIVEFVKEFLNGIVDARTRNALRSFFHQHVSGRGLLPAIRVGRQPYGIVVTSDWDKWTINAPRTEQISIEPQLLDLMRVHRKNWQDLATSGPPTGGGTINPFERFLHLVGQLASSAEYVSRKGATDAHIQEYIDLSGTSKDLQTEWRDELVKQRTPNLNKIIPTRLQSQPLLSKFLFTEQTNPWVAPIIDRDPEVPLSERALIAPFDGVRNYLHWLAHASLDALQAERFVGPDGTVIAAPTALLYVILRYSLLTAVEEGGLGVAATEGSRFFDVIERDPLIANIGSAQHVLRRDYLDIDAARLGLASVSKPLANWVHESARLAEVGSPLANVLAVVTDANDAIGALAGIPTARLERLLAEHIDLCSYRLDAWISALYAQRLEQMRGAQQSPGLYLGAYGWVEHLAPNWNLRTPVSIDELPASLRGAVRGPVFQSSDNGGFVHAPSLPQAVSAAVLRNAYLAHSSPEQRDLFSVNLSSSRMRVAQTYIEGIRNGQSMAALLGYEFERGLHERHPGIELDQYRYVLRDRFPFLAGKLTELKAGVNAEVVEARNVVHGLDLLEYTAERTYPYEIAGLPAAATGEAVAIVAEIDRLRDGLDAVSDLLLSESVHQAVQGNLERTKASLQALTDPEAAPDPEVIRTPRSARQLTFRVVLRLDQASIAQWPGSLTPRATANSAVNAWLAKLLPAPASIQWSATNGVAPVQFISAADLKMQPIDLVLLCGDQLGELSSELERLIVRNFRHAQKVADDVRTRVAPLSGPPDVVPPLVFDFTASAPGQHSLATLHPLLMRLRRIISRGRAMHALDWLPSTEIARVDPADPTGSASGDVQNDLNDRLGVGLTGLKNAKTGLEAAAAALVPLQPEIDAMRAALLEAHDYGIPEALPAEGESLTQSFVDVLAAQAKAVLALITKRLATVDMLSAPFTDPLPTTEPELTTEKARRITLGLERAEDAARELFGAAFVIVPLFQFHQPAQVTELNLAGSDPAIADPFQVEEWMYSTARVRPIIADITWTMAVSAWVGGPLTDPSVIQLPRTAGAPWIGGEFSTPLPDGDWLSIVTLGGGAGFSDLQCGLVLDEWTENVPAERATTGIAFQFNRPNATAPQALLVAVPPVAGGQWQWDALKGCVREAYELARLRAVEPDDLAKNGYFQGLPAIMSEFTRNRLSAMNLTELSASAALHVNK
jgi:hypothetical protein